VFQYFPGSERMTVGKPKSPELLKQIPQSLPVFWHNDLLVGDVYRIGMRSIALGIDDRAGIGHAVAFAPRVRTIEHNHTPQRTRRTRSHLHAFLLRIVVRERNDRCRQPFLMTIQLADFDFGARLGVFDRHAAQGDVLLQDGRSDGAGYRAHLMSADVDAIAMGSQFVAS
jgi:hypothetical protein